MLVRDAIPERKSFLNFRSMMSAIRSAGLMLLATCCVAQAQHQPNSKQDESPKRFLQDYLADSRSEDREPTRYSSAFVDLKDDGTQEVIVYITGSFWCGTGGCTTLILAPNSSSYNIVTKVFTTRSPIRVLQTKSDGWHDISVIERGGYGGETPYLFEAKLSFDGKSYRMTPRNPPAPRLIEKIPGVVVIPATEMGLPLY
jgi:hypothetical protein